MVGQVLLAERQVLDRRKAAARLYFNNLVHQMKSHVGYTSGVNPFRHNHFQPAPG